MQLAYNYRSMPAQPGMPYDFNATASVVRSYPASAVILPGTAVELMSGAVRPAQTATTGAPPAKMIGVAMFDPAKEQSFPPDPHTGTSFPGYQVGEMVPVMVKGDIWVQIDGGGTWPVDFGAVNVWHSSDGSHNQGVFTESAPSATAGAEIDTCAAWVSGFTPSPQVSQAWTGSFTDGFGNTVKIAPLSLNFPGHV